MSSGPALSSETFCEDGTVLCLSGQGYRTDPMWCLKTTTKNRCLVTAKVWWLHVGESSSLDQGSPCSCIVPHQFRNLSVQPARVCLLAHTRRSNCGEQCCVLIHLCVGFAPHTFWAARPEASFRHSAAMPPLCASVALSVRWGSHRWLWSRWDKGQAHHAPCAHPGVSPDDVVCLPRSWVTLHTPTLSPWL